MTNYRHVDSRMNPYSSNARGEAKLDNRSHTVAWWLVLLATLLGLAGCERPSRLEGVDNLVLICIDTVRAPNFYSERIDDALTPYLGSAQQYRNAHSPSSWTIPAVASTLTGFYPIQHQAGQFRTQPANLSTELPSALGDASVTLAEMLAEKGFEARGFSAHPWFSAKFGLEQGFDKISYREGWQNVTSSFTEWLDQRGGASAAFGAAPERFFAYLHFMEAHDWHLKKRPEIAAQLSETPPELHALLREDVSSGACVDPDSRYCLRNLVYNLAVRELRGALAAIMGELEARGLLGNTAVIVYSDHGEEFWEHKAEHKLRGDPRQIFGFGHGQSLYQELLHVPLVAWHPDYAGSSREDLVSLIDVVPTALEWLGIEYGGDPLPGDPLPAGDAAVNDPVSPRVLHASGIAYGPEAIAVREGGFKSIMYFPDQRFEYFDLEQDPGEKHPVQSDALTLRFDVLTGDYIDMKQDLQLASPELNAQTLEHLKSIGYLQGVEEYAEPQAGGDTAPAREQDAGDADKEELPDS